MFYYLALPFTSILDFFDRGGPVIVVLFILAIIMTTLLLERLIFFISELNNLSKEAQKDIEAVSYTHLRAHETSLHLVSRMPSSA